MAKQAKRQLAGSGETLPAGSIGEVVVATVGAGGLTNTIGTWSTAITLPSPLTVGRWRIEANCSVYIDSATGTGVTGVAAQAQIFNSTSTTILTEARGGFINTAIPACMVNLNMSTEVQITQNTTIILRIMPIAYSGSPGNPINFGITASGAFNTLRATRVG